MTLGNIHINAFLVQEALYKELRYIVDPLFYVESVS